jgi:hypothetical protein
MEEKKYDESCYKKASRLWRCRARSCNSPHSRLAGEAAERPPIDGDASGFDNR